MKFNSKKIWDNVKEPVLIAGAGTIANVAVDAALQAAESVIPASITGNAYVVNGGKLVLGAIITTAFKNKGVQLAGTGLATVGASNIVSGLLEQWIPNAGGNEEGANGVPFIGSAKRRVGQRGFRKVVTGAGKVGVVPFMG